MENDNKYIHSVFIHSKPKDRSDLAVCASKSRNERNFRECLSEHSSVLKVLRQSLLI